MVDIAANLDKIRSQIAAACARAGREPAAVTLLAVTKGQAPAAVRTAADLGVAIFGENKIQEAKIKIGQCPGRLRWHFIGHLQSNKCRDAVHFFEMIESVDSLALALEIDKCAAKVAKTVRVLLEVNVAGESTKYGFKPDELLAQFEQINALRKVEVHGLMIIAPYTPEPEKVRPIFRRLRELKEKCDRILGVPLPHLSMGMSGDFEVAIEEGATLIRLGTALFGERARAAEAPARGGANAV